MKDDFNLLELMTKEQDNQKGIYRISPYWQSYKERVTKALYEDGLVSFRSNSRIGKGYADTLEIDPAHTISNNFKGYAYSMLLQSKIVRRYLFKPFQDLIYYHSKEAQYYRNLYREIILKEWFLEFKNSYELPNTVIADPGRVTNIDGHTIGDSYLNTFVRIHNFSQIVDFTQSRTAMEIGGGFGSACHSLLELFPNIRKFIYLDIPPVLYVGTQYLKSIYGDAVIDFKETRHEKRLEFNDDDSLQIMAIAPWQIDTLETQIDLFWNSASMQEMHLDAVENYSRQLNRLLHRENCKACFWIYGQGKADRTILKDDLVRLVEDCSGLKLMGLTHSLEGKGSCDYFVGDFPRNSNNSLLND